MCTPQNKVRTNHYQINSPLTLLWWATLISIPLLSYFGRPLQHFAQSTMTRDGISLLISVMLAGLIISSAWFIMRRHGVLYLLHLLWLMPIFALIHLEIPIIEERVHFVVFGLFGFLSLKLFTTTFALSLCVALSIFDEYFQWLLPDRVGDLKDILFNLAACLIGGTIAWILAKNSTRQPANTLHTKIRRKVTPPSHD